MVDLYAVTDTVVTGLGRVDILPGGWARFVWYVERRNDEGTIENVIVDSQVMALDTIRENRRVTDAALNASHGGAEPEAGACLH